MGVKLVLRDYRKLDDEEQAAILELPKKATFRIRVSNRPTLIEILDAKCVVGAAGDLIAALDIVAGIASAADVDGSLADALEQAQADGLLRQVM